ncbi:MAG: hypothetical protein WCV82_01120 [Candidatus Paceibacterota bacterium]
MPRRIEDIKVNDRRSIRDISLAKVAPMEFERKNSTTGKMETGHEVPIHRIHRVTPPPPVLKNKRVWGRKGRFALIALAVLMLLVGVGYVSSVYFSRATFTVVPIAVPVKIDTPVLATSTSTPNYLKYEIAKFVGEAKATVPATNGPLVSTKSSGKVTLYNFYSATAQRLIAGTRLSGDSGLIYRLPGSIVVPGYTVSKGVTVPGKLVVTVQADAAGADYNLSMREAIGDMKIVAYKGTARYDALYGRLATDLTGGFSGVKKIINPTLQASTTAALQADLVARLLVQAKAAVPAGYIMYDSGYDVTFSPSVIGGSDATAATLTVNGTLYSILFKKEELVRKLAGPEKVATFRGLPYEPAGLEELSFSIAKPSSFSGAKANTLIARMKGDLRLIGTVPTDELKGKLAGLSLADTGAVLDSYRSVIDVVKSSGALFPSWARFVPTDPARISIVVSDQ